MAANQDAQVVVTFENHIVPNEAASKAAGRPIWSDMELCKIRFAGDRLKVLAFNAHEVDTNTTRSWRESGRIGPHEEITYAQAYSEQYKQFKAGQAQTMGGTPLEELTFLTAARRSELRALNIHTAEALASLDGTPLKQLGMGGREMKNQARAYLDKAAGQADVTALAAENTALRSQLEGMKELLENFRTKSTKTRFQREVEKIVSENPVQPVEEGDLEPVEEEPEALPEEPEDDIALWFKQASDDELKAYIRDQGGEVPRGKASRETLEARAREIVESQESR